MFFWKAKTKLARYLEHGERGALSPQHQLAQLAAKGCLSNIFYSDVQAQLFRHSCRRSLFIWSFK